MNDQDPGDEDDVATSPRRFWPRFVYGTMSYTPWRWRYELLPCPSPHDPGDEEPRWEPLSDVSRKRVYARIL